MRRSIRYAFAVMGCLCAEGVAAAADGGADVEVSGQAPSQSTAAPATTVAWAQPAPSRYRPAYWRSWQSRPSPDRYGGYGIRDWRAARDPPYWRWDGYRRYGAWSDRYDRAPPARDWQWRTLRPAGSLYAGQYANQYATPYTRRSW